MRFNNSSLTMHFKPASTAVRSAVVDSLLIAALIACGVLKFGPCFVTQNLTSF